MGPPSQGVKVSRHVHVAQLKFQVAQRVDHVVHRVVVIVLLRLRSPAFRNPFETALHIFQMLLDRADPALQHARQVRHVLLLQPRQFLLPLLPNSFHSSFEQLPLLVGQLGQRGGAAGNRRVRRRQLRQAAEPLELLGGQLGHDAMHHLVVSFERRGFRPSVRAAIVVVVAAVLTGSGRSVARLDDAQRPSGVHFHRLDLLAAATASIVVVRGRLDLLVPLLLVGRELGPLLARGQIHPDVQSGWNGVVFREELPLVRRHYFLGFGDGEYLKRSAEGGHSQAAGGHEGCPVQQHGGGVQEQAGR
mmetsp:Transcript_32141/g.68418  ORF Transcript_32141/g.68418 Transcript_32141/m.68418 type:complete len:304 (+) Transcript_32141:994-1905(+)